VAPSSSPEYRSVHMNSGSSFPPRPGANEALVAAVKAIVANARAGDLDAAYVGYGELFSSPSFRVYHPDDRRRALRLMVHAKGVPDPPTPVMVEAHRAAMEPLRELVTEWHEPADYEMLGMAMVAAGDEKGAGEAYRAGLAIERERSLQSDLCGTLMKRISML
jgi:hypothetical protein